MTISPRFHDTCIGMKETPGNPCRCCCDPCIDERCQAHTSDHSKCPQPKRYWWYKRDSWDWQHWWRFLYFGEDEFCNRTIVFRLWKPLVVALNIPLRAESCDECLEPYDPRPERKEE